MHHVCYEVDDILAARDQLKAAGARVLGDGKPKIGAHGKPVLFLHPKDFHGHAGRTGAGMSWISFARSIFIIWWLVLFAILPFGLKTQDEDEDVTLGTVASAPRGPHVLRAMLRTTIVSALMLAVFYGVDQGARSTLRRYPELPSRRSKLNGVCSKCQLGEVRPSQVVDSAQKKCKARGLAI